jgi:hypothetical protein
MLWCYFETKKRDFKISGQWSEFSDQFMVYVKQLKSIFFEVKQFNFNVNKLNTKTEHCFLSPSHSA